MSWLGSNARGMLVRLKDAHTPPYRTTSTVLLITLALAALLAVIAHGQGAATASGTNAIMPMLGVGELALLAVLAPRDGKGSAGPVRSPWSPR